jgi:hypothetical protein
VRKTCISCLIDANIPYWFHIQCWKWQFCSDLQSASRSASKICKQEVDQSDNNC